MELSWETCGLLFRAESYRDKIYSSVASIYQQDQFPNAQTSIQLRKWVSNTIFFSKTEILFIHSKYNLVFEVFLLCKTFAYKLTLAKFESTLTIFSLTFISNEFWQWLENVIWRTKRVKRNFIFSPVISVNKEYLKHLLFMFLVEKMLNRVKNTIKQHVSPRINLLTFFAPFLLS